MSDPMTNIDADDVLASIRRLVSQTYVPVARSEPSHVPEVEPAVERLVLTPDFRVQEQSATVEDSDVAQLDSTREEHLFEDDSAGADIGVSKSPSVELSEAHRAPFVLTPEAAIEIPSVQSARDVEVQTPFVLEPSTALASDEAIPEPSKATKAVDAVLPTISNELAAGGWHAGLDDTPDAKAANYAAGLSLEQRISELEVAVGAQGEDEWEPDGSEDLAAQIPQSVPRAFLEAGASVLTLRSAEAEPAAVPSNAVAEPQGNVAEPLDLVANIQAKAPDPEGAPLKVVAAQPEEESKLEAAMAAMAARPDVAAQVAQPAEDVTPEEDFAPAGYPDELDVEALRGLIAEVLREELQGTLGERMTGNVRRLVRKEVQRALALKDFE